jgi:hypothetical protein
VGAAVVVSMAVAAVVLLRHVRPAGEAAGAGPDADGPEPPAAGSPSVASS